MLKIAVFVSGRGSNFQAVLNEINSRGLNAEIKYLISDKLNCGAIEIAKENGIKVFSVSEIIKENFIDYTELIKNFTESKIELIVLAGFLKKIPDQLIEKFENRIINIHPALLPSFGGKGMYGMNVHKAVFETSAKVSGATIHFVDKVYDNGKIIYQKCVDISEVNSPEEIAEKILKIEHEILPFVIKKFSENKISFEKNRVIIQQ